MWTHAFLFGSLMVEGETLLPHRCPPRAGRIRLPGTLDEGFFYTTFAAAVLLNDGSLKGDSLELGYLQGDIPGSSGEVSAIVAAAVALALLIVLVPGCLCQLLRLGLQQLVEGFLHAASYQLLKPPLDNILV